MSPNSSANQESSFGEILGLIEAKYNLKILIFLLLLLIAAIGIFYWDYAKIPSDQRSLHILLETIASSLVVASVVGGIYELYVRRETEKKLRTTLKMELRLSREAEEDRLKELIPDALVLNHEVQKGVLNRNRVEDVVLVGLETMLGSRDLAEFAYEGLIKKIVGFDEKWFDYSQEFTLSRLGATFRKEIQDKYYGLTIDMKYDTVLQTTSFSFASLGSKAAFRKSFNQQARNYNYGFPTSDVIPKVTSEHFCLRDFSISSSEKNIGLDSFSMAENSDDGVFEITITSPELETLINNSVRVHYVLETLVNKQSRILSVPILFPTRGVKVSLDYADTEISRVSLYHYLISRLANKPVFVPKNKPHRVYLESKEWVFPGSGMIFVWRFPKDSNKQVELDIPTKIEDLQDEINPVGLENLSGTTEKAK